MRRAFLPFSLMFLLCFAPFWARTQSAPPKSGRAELFEKLRSEVFKGNKWALRDMGTMLDDRQYWAGVVAFLQRTSVFLPQELDWSKVSGKAPFLQFFYQNHEKLAFDHALGVWYLTPLEKTRLDTFVLTSTKNLPPQPEKAMKNAAQSLRQGIAAADTALFGQGIRSLAALERPDAWALLLETARRDADLDAAFAPKNYPVRLELLRALQHCPEDEALALGFKWLESGKITATDAEIPLSEMANHYINKVSKEDILRQLRPLRDSLGSLAALRQHGFDLVVPFEPMFFEEEVDYFGHVLDYTWAQPWARHTALHQLAVSRHPRSLYYLAAWMFRHRYEAEGQEVAEKFTAQYLRPIEALTCLELAVPDKTGVLSTASTDAVWLLNYVRYWALHWRDYEWDEKRGYFINRQQAETLVGAYEKLFQRLTSQRDSIAQAAYRQLAEGDPLEVLPLAEQYRQTVRTLHPSLPSFKQRYLEQLSLLTDFARDNKFGWKPSGKLAEWLEEAGGPLLPAERYRLENQAIESFSLDDATALEFEALMREANRAFSFSATRVLDGVYRRHWSAVLADERQLRFFLKKSALFAGIGTVGACNTYLQKFDPSDAALRSKIAALATRETDEDIQKQIQKWLEKPSAPTNSSAAQKPENQPDAEKTLLQNIEKLRASDSLSVEVFNQVLNSPAYRVAEHKRAVLEALPRLRPAAQLRRLLPNPKFSVREDLVFFEKLDVKPKDLPGLLRLFDGDDPARMLDFLWQKTTGLSEVERGTFFNEVLRTDWLRRYLNQLPATTQLTENLYAVLQNWLDAAEEISEFEEENGRMHLLLLGTVGESRMDKLEATFFLDANDRMKFKIQREVLADASFADLKQLVALAGRLYPDESGAPGYLFLNRDFGLPPLAFDRAAERKWLAKVLDSLPEADVYKFCLRRFGVPFETAAGKLDLQVIRDILRFDLLMPFVGGGGERRDWYVYAVIKILEHEYGTRLGFHQKLNENQTFYTFNAAKRAAAWLQFLDERRDK